MKNEVAGQIVDVIAGKIFPGKVVYEDNRIVQILKQEDAPSVYIMPGLIDSHIHIESSMLVPSEFSRMVVGHGTVATVSDPHEIGNVLGIEGVLFMIENATTVPMHFYFGAPSCVPATTFETSGAVIDSESIQSLLERDDIVYLSEMMNYPGVIHKDSEVMKKITIAHKLGKPIDGHAPGLRGKDLDAYLAAGITTDHEAYTYDEGKEKIAKGMKILIREGSAARNFEALIPLLGEHPDLIMFCTDDKPEGYEKGHINLFIKWAVEKGHDPMAAIRAATRNPVQHYGLKTGLLQVGDPATFIVVNNLREFKVLETFIDGNKVASNGKLLFETKRTIAPNKFNRKRIKKEQLQIPAEGANIRVIEAIEGELITNQIVIPAKIVNGFVESDPNQDVLKLVVVNRYQEAPIAIGFIKNVGLKEGAIGATVAHDSHNIIAVGVDDTSLANAINALIDAKGGLVAANGDQIMLLPLPVAGLMSLEPGEVVSKQYQLIKQKAQEYGATLKDPFMTLSFMALLVIPELKLSDKGLFDGKQFALTQLFK